MDRWITGTVVENYRWNDWLYSLMVDAPMTDFEAGQFTRLGLELDGDFVARPYSFVNPPGELPLEFFYVTVPDGPLTRKLTSLAAGDTIQLESKPQGVMILSRMQAAQNLWLFASGTAVGPFISILKTAVPWQHYENVVLAYGVRFAADLTHQHVIGELREQYGERFQFVPLVTREATDFALPYRIPQAIQAGTLEERAGLNLDPQTSQAMICGSSAMVKDTTAMLGERGLVRNRPRKPGHITVESYF